MRLVFLCSVLFIHEIVYFLLSLSLSLEYNMINSININLDEELTHMNTLFIFNISKC